MKKSVTNLYRTLALMTTDNSYYVKEKWNREIQQEIGEEAWLEICTSANKVTNANLWKEFQWKINRFFKEPFAVAVA